MEDDYEISIDEHHQSDCIYHPKSLSPEQLPYFCPVCIARWDYNPKTREWTKR